MAKITLLGALIRKLRRNEGKIIPRLRSIPMFSGLTFRELKKIEKITRRRTFKAGEIVFQENKPGMGMYMIEKGLVRLAKKNARKEIKTGEIKAGEFFGEMSLLEAYKRADKAAAALQTEALGISRDDFFSLISENPRLGAKIMMKFSERLADRLRKATESKMKESS